MAWLLMGEEMIVVAGKSMWWGPGLQVSRDLGETWEEAEKRIFFSDDGDRTVERIWFLTEVNGDFLAGVYVGKQGGQLLTSRDGDDHWETIFNWLPPIYSVEAAVVNV